MESYNEVSEKRNAMHNNPESTDKDDPAFHQLDSIRVRCPECFKLYTVTTNEIKVPQPRFSCSKCEGKFWLSFPESFDKQEVVGFPLDWLESKESIPAAKPPVAATTDSEHQQANGPDSTPIDADLEASSFAPEAELQKPVVDPISSTFPCPKCETPYVGGTKECSSCGVVFEKFENKKEQTAAEPQVAKTYDLKTLWDEVIANYTNEVFHKTFINACQEQENLTYAANRYNTILEIHPSDDISLKFRDQILALTLAQADSNLGRQFKEDGRPHRNFKFTSLVMLLSGIIIAIGYFIPSLRNLMAFGASILFFTIAVRFYFKV